MPGDPTTSNRRGLFRHAVRRTLGHAAEEVQARLPVVVPRRRPPGSVGELEFLARCTGGAGCRACVEACPSFSIFTLAEGAASAPGTPVMVPDDRACTMCDGFPCAAACDTGALLVPDLPLSTSGVRLGRVRVNPDRCFVFRGPECGACAGLCPDDVKALTLRLGRPSVDETACVGCGLCIDACPTTPAAIDLLPLTSDAPLDAPAE